MERIQNSNSSLRHNDLLLLSRTPLFSYMSTEEIEQVLSRLDYLIRDYRRGEIMMVSGDPTDMSGLVLKGKAKILTAPGVDGCQRIMAEIGCGEMYAEPFNCLSFDTAPSTVFASTDLRVLLLDLRGIFDLDVDVLLVRRMLVNMSIQLAEKIVVFRNKIEVMSQPTLKQKILATVKQQAEYQGTTNPIIRFTKGEFAEFLCVNRNTFAQALNSLQEDGELEIKDKHYKLLKPEGIQFVLRGKYSPSSGIHTNI